MSKLIRIGIVAVFALALAAATGQTSAQGQPKAASKGTIAFLLSGPDLYYQDGMNGAKAAAESLGYNLKVYSNPNISPSVELANVQNAIAQGAKAITGYSVGLSTEDASIAAAGKANVPILLMYGYSPKYLTKPSVVGFEQVNVVDYGKAVGQYVAKNFTGQLAIITGQLGRGDAEGYRTGFLQGAGCKGNTTAGLPPMTCANGKIQYVATETGHWLRPDGYKAAQDMIAKYPNLKILFSENDDMAVGAHTALVAAHKDQQVSMVSMNGAPYGLVGVKAGWIKAENTDSPALEGLNAVKLLNGYINKQVPGGKLYYSYTVFITKANMADAVGWNFFTNPRMVATYMKMPLLKPVVAPPGT
ncbi:MAG TPA: sugar ABC transporter substrate-binding protein [Gaiellaceae bacterium]|nr:sugar ABC transporter substrate-binding protein [Gaiellaceae bacterium]